MIYDIFIRQKRIKRYDLYRPLLICQMDKFIDHVMSFYLLKYYIFTRHKFESSGPGLWVLRPAHQRKCHGKNPMELGWNSVD